jgi:hypothetical protein
MASTAAKPSAPKPKVDADAQAQAWREILGDDTCPTDTALTTI